MKVGSLVEYLGANLTEFEKYCVSFYGLTLPVKGEIYTVRGFYNDKTLLLEEIVNPQAKFKSGETKEPGFQTRLFREIQPPMDEEIAELMECQCIEI